MQSFANLLRDGKIRAWSKALFLFTLFLSMGSGTLHSQAIGGGQIQGTVTDGTGSAVSGATVLAVQTDSGLQRTVTSEADGGYNLPSLPVGPYTLEVNQTGFKDYRLTGIVLIAAQVVELNVTMQIGASSQTVTVTSADRKSVV